MLYLFIGAENLIPPLHKGDHSVFKPGPCCYTFGIWSGSSSSPLLFGPKSHNNNKQLMDRGSITPVKLKKWICKRGLAAVFWFSLTITSVTVGIVDASRCCKNTQVLSVDVIWRVHLSPRITSQPLRSVKLIYSTSSGPRGFIFWFVND